MTFDYPGACLHGKEPEKGISGGAVFLIMYANSTRSLFSVALVYFIVGISYNAFFRQRSGLTLLPQAQFWVGLPLYFIVS